MCRAFVKLSGHGGYRRNVICDPDLAAHLVFIKRLRCPVCRKTASLLPWFLVPRFQCSLTLIIDSLREKKAVCRQQLQHWCKRFRRNTNVIMAFIRETDLTACLPRAPDNKAIELLRTIENQGSARFSALFHKRFRRSFMAT
jgi:hypothetical protein